MIFSWFNLNFIRNLVLCLLQLRNHSIEEISMKIGLKKFLTTRKNLSHGWSRLKSFAGKLTDSGKMGQPGNPIQDNLTNFSLGLSMLFGRISLILSSEVCQSGNHKKCDYFKTKNDFYHTFNEMNL